jgi:hypothetical protein
MALAFIDYDASVFYLKSFLDSNGLGLVSDWFDYTLKLTIFWDFIIFKELLGF